MGQLQVNLLDKFFGYFPKTITSEARLLSHFGVFEEAA
jgi:hypothetical protein